VQIIRATRAQRRRRVATSSCNLHCNQWLYLTDAQTGERSVRLAGAAGGRGVEFVSGW
jgi:hypothetical protein